MFAIKQTTNTVYANSNDDLKVNIVFYTIHIGSFTVDTPSFHCKIPAYSSINNTIPREFINGQWKWSECRVFSNQNSSSVSANQNSTKSCTRGYEFDDSYDSTIVTEVRIRIFCLFKN